MPTPLSWKAFSSTAVQAFPISHAGGTGSDVVITALPEPTSAATLFAGFGLLASLQHFRRRTAYLASDEFEAIPHWRRREGGYCFSTHSRPRVRRSGRRSLWWPGDS